MQNMHQHSLTPDLVISDKRLDPARGKRLQKLVFFPEFHWLVVFLSHSAGFCKRKQLSLTLDYTARL
jgi:hypothetical protein